MGDDVKTPAGWVAKGSALNTLTHSWMYRFHGLGGRLLATFEPAAAAAPEGGAHVSVSRADGTRPKPENEAAVVRAFLRTGEGAPPIYRRAVTSSVVHFVQPDGGPGGDDEPAVRALVSLGFARVVVPRE